MPGQSNRSTVHFERWFLAFGGVGLAIAIILADLLSHDLGSMEILGLLWPSGIIGIIDPSTSSAQMVTAFIMYGGQFVLYGLIGLFSAIAVSQIRTRRLQQQTGTALEAPLK
ncbi:MAG: hypothetical protein ACRYFU_15955 [Janthinobacterium lividum]